jgi:hypothetical protein
MWSYLNEYVLAEIFDLLPSLTDLYHCSLTCAHWHKGIENQRKFTLDQKLPSTFFSVDAMRGFLEAEVLPALPAAPLRGHDAPARRQRRRMEGRVQGRYSPNSYQDFIIISLPPSITRVFNV